MVHQYLLQAKTPFTLQRRCDIAHPSYVTLISGVVEGLKTSSYLTDIVEDEFIYYGTPDFQTIPKFPAITVELTEADETWKTFPNGKDVDATFTVRIYDEAYDYVSGLQSVEDIARRVSDTFEATTGFSGLIYQSYTSSKQFAMFDYDNVAFFACEIELLTKTRFAPASS